MTARPPAMTQQTASELLHQQIQLLTTICDLQSKQLAILQQNRAPGRDGGQSNYVKIVDFNMPFFALMGMLIKVALAAIPAGLILAVLWGFVAGAVVFTLSTLGLLLSR